MTIEIPNLRDTFINSVGCCWQVNVDDLDVSAVEGMLVAAIDGTGFVRCEIERGRQGSGDGQTIHLHVEIATPRYFGGNFPSVTSKMEEIVERLRLATEKRQLRHPSITIHFNIPIEQIAVGSALSAVVGFQSELSNHGALLTEGKLDVIRDENSPLDYLSFRLEGSGDDMSFDIVVQGIGESEFTPDCLRNAAARGLGVFSKLVLAK